MEMDINILKDILQDCIGKYIVENNIQYVDFCLKIEPSIKVGKYFLKNRKEEMMELLFPYIDNEELNYIMEAICEESYTLNKYPIIDFLIKKGVDFNSIETSSFDLVFKRENIYLLEILLKAGLKLDRFKAKDFKDVRSEKMVKLLLENNASVDLKGALYKACLLDDDLESIKFLLTFNQTQDVLNKALIASLKYGYGRWELKTIKLLIERGADIKKISDSDIEDYYNHYDDYNSCTKYGKFFLKAFMTEDLELYKEKIDEYYPYGRNRMLHMTNYDKIIKLLHKK